MTTQNETFEYGELIEVKLFSESFWQKRIFIAQKNGPFKSPFKSFVCVEIDSEKAFKEYAKFSVSEWQQARKIQTESETKQTTKKLMAPAIVDAEMIEKCECECEDHDRYSYYQFCGNYNGNTTFGLFESEEEAKCALRSYFKSWPATLNIDGKSVPMFFEI